jgi:hypothetical protein
VLRARGVRLDVAAASARSKHHPVNEIGHSIARGPCTVADGVSGSATSLAKPVVRRTHVAWTGIG